MLNVPLSSWKQKVPEKTQKIPRKFLIPMCFTELNRTIRVDGFTFLADFVVVNFEPDPRVPIILGRPFLRTVKALIDLYEEKLTLRVVRRGLATLDSLPPGNDDSTLKKDCHEETFQNDKDAEIKSSSSFTLTSPEESEFEAYLERDSIPPGIDLILPPTLEVLSSYTTSLL
ncbi:reverse transcriptase domain-containing protein [Tanacetum coccineum]